MIAVFKRELRSFFATTLGAVFVAGFAFLLGIFACSLHFSSRMNGFEYTLYNACFSLFLLIPLLTMRSVAEERRQKTDQLLFSLPLSSAKIVLGKYLAMLAVLALPLVVAAVIPLVMELYGQVNLALAYASLLGFFLLGAALTALGLWISSLTENPLLSAVSSFLVMLCTYFMGSLSGLLNGSAESSLLAFSVVALAGGALLYALTKKAVPALTVAGAVIVFLLLLYFLAPSVLEGSFRAAVSSVGLFDRFYSFVNGIFDWQCVLYYVSVSGLFFFFSVLSVEKRRWS